MVPPMGLTTNVWRGGCATNKDLSIINGCDSSSSRYVHCRYRPRQKGASFFRALVGIVSLLHLGCASAEDGFSFFGTWPTQTLQQLQGALSGPFGLFLGKFQQQPQTPPSGDLRRGPVRQMQQQPVVLGHQTAAARLQQHPNHAVLAPLLTPEQIARKASATAEAATHQVHMLGNSVEAFVASLREQVAFRAQMHHERQQQQQQQHAWEAHECLQTYSFASAVFRTLQQQQIEEAMEGARETIDRLLNFEEDEDTAEEQGYQWQQPKQEGNAQPQESAVFMRNALSPPFSWRPPRRPSAAQGSPPPYRNHQREMLLQQRTELHGHLIARLADLEKRSLQEVAIIRHHLEKLFQWSDACAMDGIGRLSEEVDELSEAVADLLDDDASFAAAATSALQQLLHMLEDRQTTEQAVADANSALTKVLQPALKHLQQMHQELQQQRLPVLQQMKKTRRKLGLLVETAGGIARSGGDDVLLHGGVFCRQLLQHWQRLQPPHFEGKLLLAQQLHHERVIEGMKSLAANLRSFLAFGSPGGGDLKGGEAEQQLKRQVNVQAQKLRHQQGNMEDVAAAAASLRDAALELAVQIQIGVKLLHKQVFWGTPFTLPQLEEVPSERLLQLSPVALAESMHQVEQQAAEQLEKLSDATKCFEGEASAPHTTTNPAAVATAAAKLWSRYTELELKRATEAEGRERAEQLGIEMAEGGEASTGEEASTRAEESRDTSPSSSPDRVAAQEAAGADEQQANASAAAVAPDPAAAPSAEASHIAADSAEAAAAGIISGYIQCVWDIKAQLNAAAAIYGSAQQHIAAAVVASVAREELEVYIFKQRERQELQLMAEGTREQLRQQLKKQATTLARLAATGRGKSAREK